MCLHVRENIIYIRRENPMAELFVCGKMYNNLNNNRFRMNVIVVRKSVSFF